MSTSPLDYNAQVLDEFHAREGRVGGTWEETPMLLLHRTGAKSGKGRVIPCLPERRGRHVVIASNVGAPTSPGWYHSVQAHANVTIEGPSDDLGPTGA
jgi:deazaflavin-dependent oxidoreductase (nitroreductase family)